jgi:hypothetical protein
MLGLQIGYPSSHGLHVLLQAGENAAQILKLIAGPSGCAGFGKIPRRRIESSGA